MPTVHAIAPSYSVRLVDNEQWSEFDLGLVAVPPALSYSNPTDNQWEYGVEAFAPVPDLSEDTTQDTPNTWVLLQLEGPVPPPVPPISLATVGPIIVSRAGGELMTATGVFPTYSTVLVHMGPLGTSEDPLCYGGLGLGYEALSLDGVTLQFAAPPLPKGSVGVTIVFGIYTASVVGTVQVVERNWPGKLHTLRKSFSPWTSVGNRRLEMEDLE